MLRLFYADGSNRRTAHDALLLASAGSHTLQRLAALPPPAEAASQAHALRQLGASLSQARDDVVQCGAAQPECFAGLPANNSMLVSFVLAVFAGLSLSLRLALSDN
jgi:hypothetical protein